MKCKSLLLFVVIMLNASMSFSETGFFLLRGNPYASLKSEIKDEKVAKMYIDLMDKIYQKDQKVRRGPTDGMKMYLSDSINFNTWMDFVKQHGFLSPIDSVFIRLLGKEEYSKFASHYIAITMHWSDCHGLPMLDAIQASIPKGTCTKRDLMEHFWRYLARKIQFALSFHEKPIDMLILPYFAPEYQDVYQYTFGKFMQPITEGNKDQFIIINNIEIKNDVMNWDKASMQSRYFNKATLDYLLLLAKKDLEYLIRVTYSPKYLPKNFRLFISNNLHYLKNTTSYKI